MRINTIKKDILYVGSLDKDRRLFDELIPLPQGTSYNSYLVIGNQKTALIDTVDPDKIDDLLRNLSDIKNIDYIVTNHAEQDHSGSLPKLLEKYNQAMVVTNPKCKSILQDLLHIDEQKFIVVEEGQELSLGNKTLKFVMTPWVHWPETMVTYLIEDRILFSCDFLGAHSAQDELYAKEDIYEPAKRYYAEIMMPFRTNARNNLVKLELLDIDIVCPSHGPIHNNPKFIIDAYKDWTSDNVKNQAIIAYVSMHGSTKVMVNYLTKALEKNNIEVKLFNLSTADVGELAVSLVDAATLIIGSPTVLGGAHPIVAYGAYLINALRPKTRFVSIIGNYGWGGKMVEGLQSMISNLKVEVLEPILIKGLPREQDLLGLDKLVEEIIEKHKSINLL